MCGGLAGCADAMQAGVCAPRFRVAVVLTVAKVSAGGGGAYAQYLDGRTRAPEQGDYYLRDGERVEAPGRWVLGPDGAAALGVNPHAPVDGDEFRAVMAVRHPVSGEQLRRVGANGEAVVAIDATFSAPKSVSAVWALASPEVRSAIELAQERAVDRALEHARGVVPMVRRRVDSETVVRELPREVLASSWQHTTARAVEGRAPDPQLHSHVLVHGALRSDGRVVAVESRAWMVHQREIGAAYRSQLAMELKAMGFEVERGTGRGGRYFELAGVPDGLRERWSSRHHQVAEAIERRLAEKRAALEQLIQAGGPEAQAAGERLDALVRSGRLMPAEERRFALSSRAAKGGLATAGDLDLEWWQTAVEYGFDARSVAALLEHGRERQPALGVDLDRVVLGGLTEFDATFAAREARAVAFEAAGELGPERGLEALARLVDRGEVLDLADGRQTTRAHRVLEHATVADARELAGGRVPVVNDFYVDIELGALRIEVAERGGVLAAEQEQAVRAACSDRQVVVVVGQAGTGKSTALLGVARSHEQVGREVIVASTGAQAAERLAGELRDGGVNARGFSTTALRAGADSGRVDLSENVTVLHDEAALASTREQAWLFGAVRETGARLVEIGDARQSQAVGAGGLWQAVEDIARSEDALVELSRIVRAQDPADRRDQSLWRSGQHDRAVEGYTERGHVTVAHDQALAQDLALDAAHADRRAGKRTLVIAESSNEQLDALNARAQAIRHEHGELGHDSVPVSGRPYDLHAGDDVIIRAPIRHDHLGAVRNGVTGRVVGASRSRGEVVLRLADGRAGRFDRRMIDAAQMRLGYVSHPVPAQGATSDTTHVIVERHASREGSYVALTRARERTTVYAAADTLELPRDASREQTTRALANKLSRSEPEMPSISIPLAHEQRVELEHGRQSRPRTPRERREIEVLRERRDQLREVLATFPRAAGARVRFLQGEVDHQNERLEQAQERAAQARVELDRLAALERDRRSDQRDRSGQCEQTTRPGRARARAPRASVRGRADRRARRQRPRESTSRNPGARKRGRKPLALGTGAPRRTRATQARRQCARHRARPPRPSRNR